IRGIDEMMDLPRASVLLVDRRDLDREHETDGIAAGCGQPRSDFGLDVRAQAVQPRLGRDQLLLQLGKPGRMHAVAGGDNGKALAGTPEGEVLEIEIAAGGARVSGMDMQVCVKRHFSLPRLSAMRGAGRHYKMRHRFGAKSACG